MGFFDFLKPRKKIKPVIAPAKPPVKAEPKPVKLGIPTRSEMNEVSDMIIELGYKGYGPYINMREDKGKPNQSKEITPMILRQGGKKGEAYCQFGQQDHIDALCAYYDINRKYLMYPEGGGTQRVFEMVLPKYKSDKPDVLKLWTIQYNKKAKGHIELIKKMLPDNVVSTLGFNTDIGTNKKLVRDGQGAGYCTRTLFKSKKVDSNLVETRGYVDLYQIIVDAIELQSNNKA